MLWKLPNEISKASQKTFSPENMKTQQPNSELLIFSETEPGVFCLTLNDPLRLNALSEAMMNALNDALDRAIESPEVRVIILAAVGPVFCAGHDLKELTAERQVS